MKRGDRPRYRLKHRRESRQVLKAIGELSELWRSKVRRFRIIHDVDRKARIIRIFAIGRRREVHEELTDRLRRAAAKK